MQTIFENVKNKKPIVHSITNNVTINDCANAILAIGASPIMADEIKEVNEITSLSDSLYLNIGTINERTLSSMLLCGKKANELKIPIVLDPVGVGASKFRKESVLKILSNLHVNIIKGNVSEIYSLANSYIKQPGVDSDSSLSENLEKNISICKQVSNEYNSIIIMTSNIDIISFKEKTALIFNGDKKMSSITGTGCISGSLVASFCAANKSNLFESCIIAMSYIGFCGEMAASQSLGNYSFKNLLFDNLSNLNYQIWKEGARFEIRK